METEWKYDELATAYLNRPDYAEEAISGVLNFNGLRYHCVIPWEAVFALTAPEFGHEGHFWPEDVPPEMMENVEREKQME